MILRHLAKDVSGTTMVEAAIAIPVVVVVTFGLLQAGLLIWTLVGLQHGIDMAARCASVTDVAKQVGWTSSSCVPGKDPKNITDSDIKAYAASSSWGVSPPASDFQVNRSTTCSGVTGDNISLQNPFTPFNLHYLFNVGFIPRSCYPTT